MKRVGLVTAESARGLDEDLPLLTAALRHAGLDPSVVVWDDPGVRWETYDLAIVRSTWDYVPRREEFLSWARRVPRLANAAPVLEWNTDKRYLAELSKEGIGIVPTRWIGPSDALEIPFESEIVVKPSVSAGARDSARYVPTERSSALAHLRRLQSAGRTAMVQPYIGRVDEVGETALIYFGGTYSHSIRKGPMLRRDARVIGDLFVEERISSCEPTESERALADRILAVVTRRWGSLLYARVDVVDAGTPLLLELEVTEPSLFVAFSSGAPERFAAAAARVADVLVDPFGLGYA